MILFFHWLFQILNVLPCEPVGFFYSKGSSAQILSGHDADFGKSVADHFLLADWQTGKGSANATYINTIAQ